MRQNFQRWLARLTINDPLEQSQARFFQIFLLVWLFITLLSIPALLLQPNPATPIPSTPIPALLPTLLAIAGILLVAAPAIALLLLRWGRFSASVTTAAFALLASHGIATFLLGIGNSATMVVFQISIAIAGLLGTRRMLLTVAGLSIAIVVVVAILEMQSPPLAGFVTHVLKTPNEPTAGLLNAQLAGMVVGFFIATTSLITVLLDRFGSALRQALASSLERERDLQTIRASLESTIGERTSALQLALDEAQTRSAVQATLLEEIELQRSTIRDLSIPVIPISSDTLVMPLVGDLDTTRLRQVQQQALRALERTATRTLVLDITGVPIVDSQVAQGFLMTVRSARLLGAQVTLVGIRPEVAQTIVGLGIDLSDVPTFQDLQSALGQSLLRKRA